jgi:outer membrane protein with beta-barrel domain
MKGLLRLFAAVGLFFAIPRATPAAAARGETWIGFQLGASAPTGDFTQTVRTRFEGGVSGTYMASKHIGVGMDLTHHGWGSTESATAEVEAFFGPGTEVDYYAIQTTGHLFCDVRTDGRVRPYAKVGSGLYTIGSRLRTSLGQFNSTESEFGYNFGGGVSASLDMSSRYRLGVAGTYHVIVTGTKTTFYTIGLSFMRGMSLP